MTKRVLMPAMMLRYASATATLADATRRNPCVDCVRWKTIQLFLPGVSQIYYFGLLAGTNDMALLARTGVGRDINRRYYT